MTRVHVSAQAEADLQRHKKAQVILYGEDIAKIKMRAIFDVARNFEADPAIKVTETSGQDGDVYKIVPCPGGYLFVMESAGFKTVISFARDDEMQSVKALLEVPTNQAQ